MKSGACAASRRSFHAVDARRLAGGYASPEHWSEDGWAWRSFRNTKWPHFWERTGPQGVHEYALRLPFDEARRGVPIRDCRVDGVCATRVDT